MERSAAAVASVAAETMLRRPLAVLQRRSLCAAAAEAERLKAIKASLTLPSTAFPLHAKHAANEPALAAKLAVDHYASQTKLRAANSTRDFILHDGPPYANGELHMGHFLNKALKDMINRWQLLRGRRVRFTPGWDCHGLPIELRALQLAGGTEAAHALSPLQIRAQAADCAREAIDAQRSSFMRWGVMGDWSQPYTTMQPAYEAAQLGVLQDMIANGLIVRGARPVHWSPASRTALAEAELDYVDAHKSSAAFIAFPLLSQPSSSSESLDGASLVIWTTTPWTIPANQAVCAREDLTYALVEVGDEVEGSSEEGKGNDGAADAPSLLILAEARLPALRDALGRELIVKRTLPGSELSGLHCAHPLSGRQVPLLFGDHVTEDAGTGLVHTAPGHGPEDFVIGNAHGLPAACPVDELGCFTSATDEAAPFSGMAVLGEGNKAVIDTLRSNGSLLSVDSKYLHRYPYDWRSKTPVIFRTTPQWFVELEGLREGALEALQSVELLPPSGRQRLEAFVRGRSEWCLSRQRSWGVPLPAFYHKQTGEALLTEETVEHVRSLVAMHGSSCWWEMDEAQLLPPRLQHEADNWSKGADTLDVWFDSGASWSAVLPQQEDTAATAPPLADLYLEGSDQHRGWFQSSLLTHVGAKGASRGAPYASIVTHGFVVDERGAKMSKSIGNVILPSELIEGIAAAAPQPAAAPEPAAEPMTGRDKKSAKKTKKQRKAERNDRGKQGPLGVDVLRLWVAMSDWTSDVAIGESVLQKPREAYRRLRNSCRFMLGNLHDFDAATDSVPLDELRGGDRYMLHQLAAFAKAVEASHDAHQTHRVVSSAIVLAGDALSADYFDAAKERLYCADATGISRRSVQTVLHHSLDTLLLALGPIVPFLVEEVHEYRREPRPPPPIERVWVSPPTEWSQPHLAQQWQIAMSVKSEVSRMIHLAQQEKRIKGGGEAMVELWADEYSPVYEALQSLSSELNDVLGVCASRLRALPQASSSGGGGEVVEAVMAEGGGEVICETPDDEVSMANRADALKIVVRATEAPRCERCWRHVPGANTDVARGKEGLEHGGWCYRGCACYS